MAVDIAYRICFGFLALLVLFSIIETLRLPESIGEAHLKILVRGYFMVNRRVLLIHAVFSAN